MGPEVAAAAGERWRVRRRRWVEFRFFKKERKKVVTKNSHCLFKQKAWLLSVGWKFFFAIKEAS